jgi:putative ABC transport system permease protein
MSDAPRPERPLWRPDLAADVRDEVAFHLDMREREYRENGLPNNEAKDAARRRFGNVQTISAEVRRIDEQAARELRRASIWADFRQDVRYSLRGLRRTPGFTSIAVLTLALGIGANTAIFSVINGLLLQPLPFPDAGRLVFLWNIRSDGDREPLGPGRMLDFREQATSLAGFAGISHLAFNLTGSGDPERINGSSVSASFFDVLGARPLLGEPFHTGVADPSAVVLTERLWVRRFNADPSIVGRTITLNGRPRHVLAVMPREFRWPSITARPAPGDEGPDLWVPGGPGDVPRVAIDEDADMTGYRNTGYLRAVARLKPGVTFGQARAEVSAIGERLSRTYLEDDGRGATLVPIREQWSGPLERPLFVLAGAVAFVLAIACANVASLLLGRGAARRRDLAVRRAIGASRARIIRQLLTEAVVLALAGAAAGLMLATWGTRALQRLAPPDLGNMGVEGFDARVLVFAVGIAVAVGVAFGVLPALELSREQLTDALVDGGIRSSGFGRRTRTRDALVALEIAVALVLLVGSTLLVRSFTALTRVDTGIDTHNLLTFDLNLTGDRAAYQAKQVQFYTVMLDRLSAVPGVRAAGAAATLPIGGDDFGTGYVIEGRPVPKPVLRGGYQIVMPGYFHAMGIPIRSGRDFRSSDTRDQPPVVLVNETLARQQWPREDPIGRRLRFDDDRAWMTIVGVVGDIRHLGPASPPRPEIYQAVTQRSFPFIAAVVRTEGDPYAFVGSIRRAIADLDPNLPLSHVRTMDEHIARALSRPRFLSTLVASFGALALLLALVGIYGMMAWAVTERRQEIAIRMALGASRREMITMILRRALALAAVGIAAGLLAAPLATRALSGLLYGIKPIDFVAFVETATALLIVALLSATMPAIRAARVQPASVVKI